MKTIQKITLGLLTVGAFTASGFAATIIDLDVATGSAEHSGLITASLAHKTGAGTLVLSNAANAITVLEIQEGQVDIAATGNFGGTASFTTNAGNKLNMVAAGVSVPALTMTMAGYLDCNGYATNLAGVPAGAGVLSIDGAGPLTMTVDASASDTPVVLMANAVVRTGVSSSSKMPSSVTTVSAGAELKIIDNTVSCAPGVTTVQSGGIVDVAALKSVPAYAAPTALAATDFFNRWDSAALAAEGSLKFESGSILRLGDGSSWARNITVGTAL